MKKSLYAMNHSKWYTFLIIAYQSSLRLIHELIAINTAMPNLIKTKLNRRSQLLRTHGVVLRSNSSFLRLLIVSFEFRNSELQFKIIFFENLKIYLKEMTNFCTNFVIFINFYKFTSSIYLTIERCSKLIVFHTITSILI